ncbi:MAG TPA: molybdopterin-dependent oxidoreductase, partial [Synergistales bacterium]|nr:molybdopterin-dependent oxidoreductase [Synergistales bacterium]
MNERVRTACPYDCPDTCPLIASPLPGGLLGIEANPDFTLGSNFICQKGARWDSIRRDPSRLKEPLMKEGVTWRPVSWDEAWSLWAERTMEATERWGPLSVFLSRGSGSLYFSKELIPRVFSAMGGYTTTKGSLCGAAGGAGLERAFGHRPVLLPGTVAENSRG